MSAISASVELFSDSHCTVPYIKMGNGSSTLAVLPGLNVTNVAEDPVTYQAESEYYAEHDFTVYIIDRRTDVKKSFSIEEMAQDTLYVMQKLKLSKPFLYGHSQGGMIAQCLLLLKESFFAKAVLCATTSYTDEKSAAILNTWFQYAAKKDKDSLFRNFAQTLYKESDFEARWKLLRQFVPSIKDEQLANFLRNGRSILDFDVRDRLKPLSIPSLVIGSVKDQVFSSDLSLELARKTGSMLYLYENAGHCIYDEEPSMNRRVAAFLKGEEL